MNIEAKMTPDDNARTLSLGEAGEWREMVRLHLDRGCDMPESIKSADLYIAALRLRVGVRRG